MDPQNWGQMVETTRIEPLMLVRSQKIMKVPKNGGDICFILNPGPPSEVRYLDP